MSALHHPEPHYRWCQACRDGDHHECWDLADPDGDAVCRCRVMRHRSNGWPEVAS